MKKEISLGDYMMTLSDRQLAASMRQRLKENRRAIAELQRRGYTVQGQLDGRTVNLCLTTDYVITKTATISL